MTRFSALKQSSEAASSKTPPSMRIVSPLENISASAARVTSTRKRASALVMSMSLSALNTRMPVHAEDVTFVTIASQCLNLISPEALTKRASAPLTAASIFSPLLKTESTEPLLMYSAADFVPPIFAVNSPAANSAWTGHDASFLFAT